MRCSHWRNLFAVSTTDFGLTLMDFELAAELWAETPPSRSADCQ